MQKDKSEQEELLDIWNSIQSKLADVGLTMEISVDEEEEAK